MCGVRVACVLWSYANHALRMLCVGRRGFVLMLRARRVMLVCVVFLSRHHSSCDVRVLCWSLPCGVDLHATQPTCVRVSCFMIVVLFFCYFLF